jgi:hypothetical protein
LTPAAKKIIKDFLTRQKVKTADAVSFCPPETPPSVDEDEYSFVSSLSLLSRVRYLTFSIHQWCSICGDRNLDLLLCAGCRVGVCIQDIDNVHLGCLEPSALTYEGDFVFYCPFCCLRKAQPFLVSAKLFSMQLIS